MVGTLAGWIVAVEIAVVVVASAVVGIVLRWCPTTGGYLLGYL